MLDVLRLVLRDSAANGLFCESAGAGSQLVGYACSILSSATGAASEAKNHLLIARVLCNAFHHPAGEKLMLESGERLLTTAVKTLEQSTDKLLQVINALLTVT